MPFFSSQYATEGTPGALTPSVALQQLGPLIPIQVEIPAALADKYQQDGTPIPNPVGGLALIDTGATTSCVNEGVFQQLGVQPVGVRTLGHAAGKATRSTYAARLTFPGTPLPSMDFSEMIGVDLAGQLPAATSFGTMIALIGRDILARCVMFYNGSEGRFTIAF